ncbi:MAG TPA: ATP-binding protein, partial [Xylella fastidiosa subsp. multiplex]
AIQAGANRITLRTRVEHGQRIRDRVNVISLRLEVIDDGDGVPEALAEHVFLPLVSSRAEGSGLGLPLAQQVAHEHHGMLTFRSQPGQTIFILSLPQMMIESDKDLHYG